MANKIATTKQLLGFLKEQHLEIPTNFEFSDINIVIGSNGSGKTRFLNAIRKWRCAKEHSIMYGYFPALSSSKKGIVQSDELPVCTLYESLQEDKITFEDFFKEIELHNEDYIPQLLHYQSIKQKDRGETTLKTLKETFSKLSGKEILIEKEMVYIKDKSGRKLLLKDEILLFSPGELMIFYMSVFISLQTNGIKKRTIILDEPECHLHPKALIQFVKILRESNYFTEIWIATHSLFLVPEFGFENIIYIDDNKVCARKSDTYSRIMSTMLGENTEKTQQFMASLSQWQYCEYIAECFNEPTVVDAINPKDEQVQLFMKFIKSQLPAKILDFGGGSARLGKSIYASKNKNARKISYEICDTNPTYEGKKFTVHKSLDNIKTQYDCIVMMNVLHEISPNKWVGIFGKISQLLKDDGYLFFVETSVLVTGEMPNNTGFLVLDKKELEVLFSSDLLTKVVLKENQKSICFAIPKSIIGNVNDDSVKKAIITLESETFEKIKLEKSDNDLKYSRKFAFLTQQYINAKLFNELNEMEELTKSDLDQQDPEKQELTNQKVEYSNIDSLQQYKTQVASMITKNFNHIVGNQVESENENLNINIHSVFKEVSMNIKTPKIKLKYIWRSIMELEKEHTDKKLIALALLCIYIAGDNELRKASENRISNNGYSKFINDILTII